MFIKENTKLSVLVFIVNYKRFCGLWTRGICGKEHAAENSRLGSLENLRLDYVVVNLRPKAAEDWTLITVFPEYMYRIQCLIPVVPVCLRAGIQCLLF